MSDKKIVVPEGMLKAATEAVLQAQCVGRSPEDGPRSIPAREQISVEAALLYLSENPMRPSDDQVEDLRNEHIGLNLKWMMVEWQRRMFLAPESKAPEPMDPQKCPHRWQRRDDLSTMERVVYCELCGWVYSRDAIGDCPCYPRSMESK